MSSPTAPHLTSPMATSAWQQLKVLANPTVPLDLRSLFSADPQRFAQYQLEAGGLVADLSKNLVTPEIDAQLLSLAEASGLDAKRQDLFNGKKINITEDRAVMHWLLRTPRDTPQPEVWMDDALQTVHDTLDAVLKFAETIRANPAITDIVNIGIGGSDLGPQMAVLALQDYAIAGKRFHFVSNVDGHEMAATLKHLKPARTLFLVASKTFTTAETMLNAETAKDWFLANGGTSANTQAHFVGLTTNIAAAAKFGISTTFGFWDWVGGRYSVWSAIGLSLAIAIGAEHFKAFLAGAHAMDTHFRTAPLARNLPVRMALLDVWYRNFMGYSSRCVAPYASSLGRLPAYLQQLEMESNGKRVDTAGQALSHATSPVVWGEPGTNGQHAFFQMLHQGTDVIPVEFIGIKTPSHTLPGHHVKLLANMLAQSQALMLGKANDNGYQHFPGNRPSTTLVLDALTPHALGALIALYEHRVFAAGVVWGINSFDQWGVELGKVLATQVEAALNTGDVTGLDASTAGWVAYLGSN
jgi:glucose-6-phosphate isomerase